MPSERPFTCAICEHDYDLRWGFLGRCQTVPPVCRICEQRYGRRTPLTDGAFMDRRKVVQIGALAEALHSEANIKKWEARYYARS